jgi:hypothetical protein
LVARWPLKNIRRDINQLLQTAIDNRWYNVVKKQKEVMPWYEPGGRPGISRLGIVLKGEALRQGNKVNSRLSLSPQER